MFDFVRKHTKLMMGVMFLLIIPSFVLFGLDGYTRMKDKGEPVAKVDGLEILQTEWDLAHKNEVDRVRRSMPSLDPKLLDSPEARYATLERLIRDRVFAAAAEKSRLTTSDQRLAQELQANESIAALRKPDGSLDMDRYRQLVGAQGMTPEMFENEVRTDVSRRQVLVGLANSGFGPVGAADVTLNAYFARREIQVARFSTLDYATKIVPTDAEIETFYKNNAAMFQAPEQANIEYVVLDLDAIRKSITVSEQDLKTYYEQNAARLAGQEERRASHILIKVDDKMKDADALTLAQREQRVDAANASFQHGIDARPLHRIDRERLQRAVQGAAGVGPAVQCMAKAVQHPAQQWRANADGRHFAQGAHFAAGRQALGRAAGHQGDQAVAQCHHLGHHWAGGQSG